MHFSLPRGRAAEKYMHVAVSFHGEGDFGSLPQAQNPGLWCAACPTESFAPPFEGTSSQSCTTVICCAKKHNAGRRFLARPKLVLYKAGGAQAVLAVSRVRLERDMKRKVVERNLTLSYLEKCVPIIERPEVTTWTHIRHPGRENRKDN